MLRFKSGSRFALRSRNIFLTRAMISSSVWSISGLASGRSRSSCRTFPSMFAMKAWRAVKWAFVSFVELKLSLPYFSAHADPPLVREPCDDVGNGRRLPPEAVSTVIIVGAALIYLLPPKANISEHDACPEVRRSSSSDDNTRCGLIKSAKVRASRTARKASVALRRARRSSQTRSIGQ
jgi:hypothetical protein